MEDNRNIQTDEISRKGAVSSSMRVAFIALLFILSFLILEPFIIMVIWGIIIAVGIYPIFTKLSKILGGKDKLASTLLTLSALALLIVPSVLLLDSTVESIQNIATEYDQGTLRVAAPPDNVAEWPFVGKPIYDTWKLASTNLETALRTLEPQIKEHGPKLVEAITGLGGTILLSIISIIISGVLLLKGETGEQTANKIFAFFIGKYGDDFTSMAGATIRSVVQGVLGVAIIQAVAAGVVMLIFNIPAAGLLALLVLFFAVIQLPPIIVLLPVAIYGFSILDTTPAIIFLILSIIISASDTFLKPIFLGRGVDVPMLVILLGAIGGMMFMGMIGLFIGAVVLALSYKVFQALINENNA